MPVISGHAPGHYREAFLDRIEGVDSDDPRSLHQLAGHLWNCTDILPGWACDQLDIERGSTYAQAARSVRI